MQIRYERKKYRYEEEQMHMCLIPGWRVSSIQDIIGKENSIHHSKDTFITALEKHDNEFTTQWIKPEI